MAVGVAIGLDLSPIDFCLCHICWEIAEVLKQNHDACQKFALFFDNRLLNEFYDPQTLKKYIYI